MIDDLNNEIQSAMSMSKDINQCQPKIFSSDPNPQD